MKQRPLQRARQLILILLFPLIWLPLLLLKQHLFESTFHLMLIDDPDLVANDLI